MRFVHTCVRVCDPEQSLRFYRNLGFEHRGRLLRDGLLPLPGTPRRRTLELTVSVGRAEPYDVGDGYSRMAVAVDDLAATLDELARGGLTRETSVLAGRPHEVDMICFVCGPDGYRIELIDGGECGTPQDPDLPAR